MQYIQTINQLSPPGKPITLGEDELSAYFQYWKNLSNCYTNCRLLELLGASTEDLNKYVTELEALLAASKTAVNQQWGAQFRIENYARSLRQGALA